jgi:hypothetical protein
MELFFCFTQQTFIFVRDTEKISVHFYYTLFFQIA